MASYTPNINLKKPTTSEMYNVLDWNDNSDKIDTAIGNLNSQIANTYPLKPQSGYSTSQTIEDFLDTLPTNESWMTTITANGSTGDIVTVSNQHLFYIVQMAVGNSNNRFQLALAINTPKLYARAKLWWGTWTSWTLV